MDAPMLDVSMVTPSSMEMDNRLSADSQIGNKYRAAADVCNAAMTAVLALCRPGARLLDLCATGDDCIRTQTRKVYQRAGESMERGIAYPTTVCVNNVVSGYAAVEGDETCLAGGDCVKIEMGAHLDGYSVSAAHTVIVPSDDDNCSAPQPVQGRLADCICAAYLAAELLCARLVPGCQSGELVEIIDQVCRTFHVRPVDGPLLHLAKRFVPASSEKSISCDECGLTDNEFEVEADDVFVVNVTMTTATDGKLKEAATRPTILCRNVEERPSALKLKSARAAFSCIDSESSVFPFSVRPYSAPQMRLGLQECTQRGLLQLVPTFSIGGRRDESVAQFKHTAVVQLTATHRLTRAGTVPYVHSVHNLPDHLQQILRQ